MGHGNFGQLPNTKYEIGDYMVNCLCAFCSILLDTGIEKEEEI